MICGNHEILERYVAGQSSPEEAADVRRHLDECHACAQAVETLRQPRMENFSPFASAPPEDYAPPAGLACPSVADLRAHLEGTLPLDRRAEVHDHLAECDECFERVRLLRQGLTVEGETVEATQALGFYHAVDDDDEAPASVPPPEESLAPAGISGFRQFLSHAAVAAAAVAVAVTVNAAGRPAAPPPRPGASGGIFGAPGTPPGGSGLRSEPRPVLPGQPAGPGSVSPGTPAPGPGPAGTPGPGGSMFGSPTRPPGPGGALGGPDNSPLGRGGTSLPTPTPRPTPFGASPGGTPPNLNLPRPSTPTPPPAPPPAVVMETVLPLRRSGGGTSPATPALAQKAIQDAAEAARTGTPAAGIRTLQDFLRNNPEAPAEVQALLGTLYLKSGDRERASEAFAEAAKQLQPPAPAPPVEPAPAPPAAPAAPGTP